MKGVTYKAGTCYICGKPCRLEEYCHQVCQEGDI